MANRISTIFDFSDRGLGKIRQDIAAADTATGKLKAGWDGAKTAVKAYGAELALAAGTAVIAGAVRAGQQFADAALNVGRFADATGLSAEQASRWVSVADDLQVNASDVEMAFVRLNNAIGKGGGAAEAYGITLQRTSTGQADVNATMLQAIEVLNGISNPTERARVAQELFGRSYANIAEIIFKDAEKMKQALESTSAAQTFDDEEIRKAREYRAAMDRLNDALVDLKMAVGEEVVPVISDLANGLIDVKEAADSIPGVPKGVQMWWDWASPKAWVGHVADGWRFLGESLGLVSDEIDRDSIRGFAARVRTELGGAVDDIGAMAREARDRIAAMGTGAGTATDIIETEIDRARANFDRFGSDGVENMNEVSDAASGTATAITGISEALDKVLGRLSEESAVNSLAEQWDRVLEAQAEYFTAEKNGSEGATKAQREYRDELIRMALDVGRFAQQVGDIPEERLVRLATAIESDSIADIERALDDIFRDRTIRLDVNAPGPTRFRRTDEGGWERVDDGGSSAVVTTQPVQQGNTYVYTVAPTPAQTNANQRELTFTGGYRPR